MLIKISRIIGLAIVAFIGGEITGYFVLLQYVKEYVSDAFLAGAISGGAGFLIWYLILSFFVLWEERR